MYCAMNIFNGNKYIIYDKNTVMFTFAIRPLGQLFAYTRQMYWYFLLVW